MNSKHIIFAASVLSVSLVMTACSDDDGFWDISTSEDWELQTNDNWSWDTETSDNSVYQSTSESATTVELRPQGSAKTLEGKSVIVTVVLDTPDATYTNEELEFTNSSIDRSCRYLEAQGDLYGKDVTLYNYSKEHPDLLYRITYDEDASVAADSSLAYSNGYIGRIQQLLKDEIPLGSIYDAYGTDSIGFMVVYDVPGNSYSQVYYPGYDDTYYEWTALFQYDIYGSRYENLACVAHEILHLFGAVDLYRVSGIDGVTQDIYDEISNDPDYEMAIMYNTYNEDGSYDYENIPQFLSNITLAMIGFTDDSEIVERYPSLSREHTAAFEIKYY